MRSEVPIMDEYGAKRDFTRTPEPEPQVSEREGPLIFVVQKHAARRLHYDLRLELDGVLKSWAMPSGPSLDPKTKRLAVMVEDHPLDYGSFEGVIPPGEYGAGQVIVWDHGTYSPEGEGQLFFHDRQEAERRMKEGLSQGKVSFVMRGSRLKGSWTLVKLKGGPKDWLMIKHHDEFAQSAPDVLAEGTSILSGVDIEDLKAGGLPPKADPRSMDPSRFEGARKASMPGCMPPMLATLVSEPVTDPQWVAEPKLDGFRVVSCLQDRKVRLWSRRGLDLTANYPTVVEDLAEQPVWQAVFDGEVVALDERGVPSFEMLQQTLGAGGARGEISATIAYYVFDLLYLDGYDLTGVKFAQRRELLEEVLAPTKRVRLVEQFKGDAGKIYDTFVNHGLEGIMLKRLDSTYEPARRSRSWVKVKATLSEDFVAGGYTQGQGGRPFGALLLGYFDREGHLVYAGHVGSGFSDRDLAEITGELERRKTDGPPFYKLPSSLPGQVTWVKPELVLEVKFNQWTQAGYLRAPVFLRLRPDKSAQEVLATDKAVTFPDRQEAPRPRRESEKVLEQLDNNQNDLTLDVAGYRINLSNLNKEFWPAPNGPRPLTKRDLLVYLAKVSDCLLSHLHDRPLTLTRYPDGVFGEHFYQKHWSLPLPEFVETASIYSEQNGEFQDYLICNNLPALMWLGQIGDLELHTWYSRITPGHDVDTILGPGAVANQIVDYPDFIVFDLDPYIYSGREKAGAEPELNRIAFARTCEVARRLREVLTALGLSSFVKTSGRTGLHVYAPIARRYDFDVIRGMAEAIGHSLMRQHPNDITMEWSVSKRTGKVFFDHNQNARGKTLASVYSARPTPHATVSMPVRWDELDRVYPEQFTIVSAPERLAQIGDLWKRILDSRTSLDSALKHDEEDLVNLAK